MRSDELGLVAGRRVALVIATTTGGTGTHVRSLSEHLTKHGIHVTILGPAVTEKTFGFTACGARFIPLEIASGLHPIADLRAVARLRPHIKDIDLIHAHGMRAGLVSTVANTGKTVPLVVTWHNILLADTRARVDTPGGVGQPTIDRAKTSLITSLLRRAERIIARGASVSLVVSPDLANRVQALGGRDVRLCPVVPPPLPPAVRSREEIRAEVEAVDRPIVLTVARFDQQKGYDVLIEAARRCADRRPQPLFLLAGDGPLRSAIEQQVADIPSPVRILGQRSDVGDLLAAADVMVLASRWEGSPLAVQEALRAGCPFVGTRVGGIPSLVGEAAVLVPPEDPAKLADALMRVLNDPNLAADLVRRGRERASTWATEEDMAEKIAGVYSELMPPEAGH